MKNSEPQYASISDWIRSEAIPYSSESTDTLNAAIDTVIDSLDDQIEILGLGEALHGGEEILKLRNLLFQNLVDRHGYSAIALESSFPRSRAVNEYVAGRGPNSYDDLIESGFSHGFGRLEMNRELVEWMRQYNSDASHEVKLQFYGFDSPTEMYGTDSPSQLLHLALDYLESVDSAGGGEYRRHIDGLLGRDSDWENPEAMMDPAKSIGISPEAAQLRIATEDLIMELHMRRPELVHKSSEGLFLKAAHHASAARQLLNYHAELAKNSSDRTARLLGKRDLMMADNLAYIVSREMGRGKVLAFAHNSHLKYGRAQWQLGPDLLTWWPAGSQLKEMFGTRYAVIGSALGASADNGIDPPEAGTLEVSMISVPGPARFIPTHRGAGLPLDEIAARPVRSGSRKNSTYFALTQESITDFDWLAVLDSASYARGGPPLG